MAPPGVWESLEALFEQDWLDSDDGDGGEQGLPTDDEPFDFCRVPGACDGNWFTPTPMAAWVPKVLLARFGEFAGSPVSGDNTIAIRSTSVSDFVNGLVEHGYTCVQDDLLISAAWGYERR